jgi:hypothetical protein
VHTGNDARLFDGSLRNSLPLEFIGLMKACMPSDRKPNEWSSLKDQFDALVHDEGVGADSIEKTFDVQFRRRFAELINRVADQSRIGTSVSSRAFYRDHS